MQAKTNNMSIFGRQSLSTLGKITVAALLIIGILCGMIWFFTGSPAIGLHILTIGLLIGAVLVATGVRWIPLLGPILGLYTLITFAGEPYVIFHLTQPKAGTPGAFPIFVFILIMLACAILATLTGIAATVQNYRQSDRRLPSWLVSILTGMAGIVIGAIFIAAIAQPAQVSNTAATGSEPTVHLGPGSFLQSSVTVPKGAKLLLVDDGSYLHVLSNGAWQNGQPVPAAEAGAPTVSNVQITGGTLEIGPFTTAGTYHIYCSIHQGMNLTIIVQ